MPLRFSYQTFLDPNDRFHLGTAPLDRSSELRRLGFLEVFRSAADFAVSTVFTVGILIQLLTKNASCKFRWRHRFIVR